MISQSNLTFFILILDLLQEDIQEALFNFDLHLGNDHPTVNLEVVKWSVSDAFRQGQACVATLHSLLRPDEPLDCVTFVGGGKLTQLLGVEKLVDGDGLLSFEACP